MQQKMISFACSSITSQTATPTTEPLASFTSLYVKPKNVVYAHMLYTGKQEYRQND